MGSRPVLISDKSVVFFDANCLLCSRFIKLVLKSEKGGLFYSGFDSRLANEILPSKMRVQPSTVVYSNHGKLLFKSEAIFSILRELRFPWPLLRIFRVLPTALNDSIYDFIAKNRISWFGRSETCFLPNQEQKARFID